MLGDSAAESLGVGVVGIFLLMQTRVKVTHGRFRSEGQRGLSHCSPPPALSSLISGFCFYISVTFLLIHCSVSCSLSPFSRGRAR